MNIQNNYHQTYTPNFQAKFFHSESLKMVADYAVQHGKFDKLNTARKNIDKSNLTTRLRMDIRVDEKGHPIVSFTQFRPKTNIVVPQSMDDYELIKCTDISANSPVNPIKFAYERIIKLGNNAPFNNYYKNIVIKKR